MSDNKGNDPYSFDSYNIIGGDNNSAPVHTGQQQSENNEGQAAPQPPTAVPQPPTAAYPFGSGQGHVNQYVGMPPKKTGRKGAMFWVLFSLLAIFDVLLFIGGSGILFFVLSLIVLVVMLVIRNSISKGIFMPILSFVGALIVTFAVFAFTGTGNGNNANISVGGNGDKNIFGFSFSIGNKDKPDVVKEGFARSVEQDTLKPVEKTTVFDPNDEFIFYSIFIKYLPENTQVVSRWYYEGDLVIESEPEIMQKAIENQYYTAHLQKGENPFPVGKYQVELIISKDGSEIVKCSDEFSVDASGGAQPAQTVKDNVVFEDSFERPDSNLAGDEWQEARMRNGTGSNVPLREAGDTPWSIKGNVLSYEGVGNGTYTEDFVQTVKEFPIADTKVEFEIRGTASTMLGYVGPGAFWTPSQEKRLGGFETTDGKHPLIGVQAFYGWENNGTKGLVFKVGGNNTVTDGILAGINQNEFVKHTIILKDGKMTYQAGDSPSVTLDLANKPEPGEKRHFSFDVRYYDDGIPFKTEIRNFKITSLE